VKDAALHLLEDIVQPCGQASRRLIGVSSLKKK
jgi:hypothetical protein